MPHTLINLLTVKSFGATDCGLVRSKNEDNFLIDDDRRVYAVADGLGGVPNGDKASLLAVQMARDYYDEAVIRGDLFLREMFEQINRSVYQEGHVHSPDLGMATTLTLAQISGNMLAIGHVGDSGVYLYRAGTVRGLTEEHTLKAAVGKSMSEEDRENIPEALSHTLTRCIGQQLNVEVDQLNLPLQPNDRILLCTDGIIKYVDADFLERAFAVASSPETLVKLLVNEARDRGGMDNATAVAIFVSSPAQPSNDRIFGLSAQSSK